MKRFYRAPSNYSSYTGYRRPQPLDHRRLSRSELRPYIEQYINDNGYTYEKYPKGEIVEWLKEVTGDLSVTSYIVKHIIDCDILGKAWY